MNVMTVLNEVLIELESGSRPKGGIRKDDIEIPSLGAEHLNDFGGFNFDKMKFVSTEFVNSMTSGIIQKEDILIVKDGATTGKVSFVNEEFPYKVASINEHLFRLQLNQTVCYPKYIFWYLWSPFGNRQVLSDFRGSTIGGIAKSFAGKVKLKLPPLSEQKRIANILDKADSLRQKRKESIALLDELLKSVFIDMFGDPVRNEKGWEVTKFGNILKSIRYGTGSPPNYSNDGFRFIRATNIKNGVVIDRDLKFISKEDTSAIEKCKVEEGDMIIVRSGVNSGDSVVISNEFSGSYAGYDMIIEIENPHNHFYSFFINSIYGKALLKPLSRRAGQPHLNADQIRNLIVINPDTLLKNEFSEVLKSASCLKKKLGVSLNEMYNHFNALLQRAFRGEGV